VCLESSRDNCDDSKKTYGYREYENTPHGGAIAAAIVSEYGVRARGAQHESDMAGGGRGVRGETNVGESPIAYIQRRIREIVARLREPEWPPNSS